MLKEFLIPILQTAARNHNEGRSIPAAILRHCQCPFQDSIAIGEGNFFLPIRKRSLWSLGTVEFLFSRSEGQRNRCAHLSKGPDYLLDKPLALVFRSDRWNVDGNGAGCSPGDFNRNPLCALVRRVHCGIVTVQMKHERKFGALQIKFA